MIALIARLSSPARHILLLSTCLLLIFGSTTPNVYAASQTKCVKASLGLRVRSGPGTQYWKKAGLPYGTQVTVNYTQGRWSKVTYSGWRTGWMYSSYLGSCPIAVTTWKPPTVTTWKPAPTAVPTQAPVVSCNRNIKGNISYTTGEKIFHVPGQEDYNSTIIRAYFGERWFCTEAEARAAGWRKAKR